MFNPTQYAGNYSGQWNNLTFGSSGGMTLAVSIDSGNNSTSFTLDLNGSVFGGGDPGAEMYSGTFNERGFRSTSTSVVFGERLMVIRTDGTMSLWAFDVPGQISWFTMDGQFTGATMSGTYVVGFLGGTTCDRNLESDAPVEVESPESIESPPYRVTQRGIICSIMRAWF